MAVVPFAIAHRVYLEVSGVDLAEETDEDPRPPRIAVGSINLTKSLNNQATLSFTVIDENGQYRPEIGQTVVLGETIMRRIGKAHFTGTIDRIEESGIGHISTPARAFAITCVDFNVLLDQLFVGRIYENVKAGQIVRDLLTADNIFSGVMDFSPGSVADFGITEAEIQDGADVTRIIFDVKTFREALSQLAALSGYSFWIDSDLAFDGSPRKGLHFVPASATLSEYRIDDGATTLRSIVIRRGREQYANNVLLRFAREAVGKTVDNFVGDGTSKSFTLSRPPATEPTVTRNGESQTVALGPEETATETAQWFWQSGSKTLAQAQANDPLLATDRLEVSYFPFFGDIFEVADDQEIANRIQVEGPLGRYQFLDEQTSLTEFAAMEQSANASLAKLVQGLSATIEVESDEPGLDLIPGSVIAVTLTKHDLADLFLVTDLSGKEEGGIMRWRFTGIPSQRRGGFQEFFRALFGAPSGGFNLLSLGLVLIDKVIFGLIDDAEVGQDVNNHYHVAVSGTPDRATINAKVAPVGADLVLDVLYLPPGLPIEETTFTISTVENVTPIAVTTATPHGLANGSRIRISGTGILALDGNGYAVTIVDTDTFTLDGTVASGASTAGAVVTTGWRTIFGPRAQVRLAISAVANTTPVKITTAEDHGFATGNQVRIEGTGIAALDDKQWIITVVDATSLTLNGSTASGLSSTGTVELAFSITNVANTAPVEITSAGHGLANGDNVRIEDTGLAGIDGLSWLVTVTGANTFTLDGSTASGSSTTGVWIKQTWQMLSKVKLTVPDGSTAIEVQKSFAPGISFEPLGRFRQDVLQVGSTTPGSGIESNVYIRYRATG